MKLYNRLLIVLSVFVFVLNINCFGQVYGKLFTRAAANEKFGSVIDSVELSVKNFQKLLNQTDNYAMFKIVNDTIIILDQNRQVLYPEGLKITAEEVFTMYSKSVIEDLISIGDSKSVFFEQRSKVLSVTIGHVTMEVGGLCPPICL